MAKESKRKLLFITLVLSMFFISSMYAALIPNAHAAQITTQQKGLSILSNVVGLDLAKYTVTTKELQADQQASYFGVVPQENVGFDLASGESKLKTLCTFVDGKLQMIHVLETEGQPSLIKPATSTNAVEMAKNFLNNYQAYVADSLYGKLMSTLDGVDASKNVTKTSGNTQFEVTATTDGYTTFKWTYAFNSVIAPSKVVALGFKNGFLKYFVDNWQLYSVGSTSISLSKNEAIAIALETAKAYNWSLKLDADTLDAKNFNESNVRWTALIFDDSIDVGKARNENLLTVYPVWRVGVALDKWYGNMYGIEIDIWADTKEVRRVQEAWSTLPPPEGTPTANVNSQASTVSEAKPNLTMLITLPTLAVATVGTALVWVSRKKNSKSHNLLRPRVLKTGGILLCALLSSMTLLTPIATVKATTRAGVVWGSESTGAGAYPNSWRKNSTEIDLQRQTAIDIASYFAANGYAAINHQGIRNPGSSKSQILADISYYQSNYNYVAVVDFDHGVGRNDYSAAPPGEFHYMFEDNTGTAVGNQTHYSWHPEHGVYDMDVYSRIQPGNKIVFALINTCLSADTTYGQGELPPQGGYPGRARGMPFAWTRRLVMDKSTPGFNIAQHISDDGYGDPDFGPQVYIGFPYGSASLMQHIPYNYGTHDYKYWVGYFFYYALYWDMSVNQALDQASLATWGVNFGNQDCQLRNGFTAYWWHANPETMSGSTMAVYGNGNIHLKQYEPDYVSTPFVSGPELGNIGTSYQFSASSTDPYGHNIQYTFNWGDGSPQTVTGWYSPGATAYASHSWGSGGQFNVTARAQCDHGTWSGWSTPHGINIGNQPVLLTIYARNQFGQAGYVPLYLNGSYVGTTGYTYTVTAGTYQIYVESPLTDWYSYYHEFQYYQYNGIFNYNNPMTLWTPTDKTIYAIYYSQYW